MKTIICLSNLLLTFTSIAFAQSKLNYQTGSGIEIQAGADVCADNISINGTFAGGGTICGTLVYGLNLTAFIQGFYDPSANVMIPDTARVYLKNNSSPYNTIDSSKTMLSSAGTGTFLFTNAANGVNYYLAVKHRNSIETWSSSGNVFSSGFSTYNFSTNSSFAFGSNEKQVDASPVRFGIYSGDENQDGSIDVTDVVDIYNDLNNTGYVATDISGDGFVDVADLLIAYNNAINIIGIVTP